MKYDVKKVNLLCKYHRVYNGYSRADIVRKMNNEVTEKTISHYETPGNYVPFSYICSLAAIVDISVQEFIGPNGYDNRLNYIDEYSQKNKNISNDSNHSSPSLNSLSELTDTEYRILIILRRLPKNVLGAIKILLSFIHELMENKSNRQKNRTLS